MTLNEIIAKLQQSLVDGLDGNLQVRHFLYSPMHNDFIVETHGNVIRIRGTRADADKNGKIK